MASFRKNLGKNFLQEKTITSYETKSFVDIELKSDSIVKLDGSSQTGLNPTGVYTSTLTLNGTPVNLSITGSQATTIADLTSVINTALGGNGSATFLGAVSGSQESVIRIQTTGASSTLVITTIGNLPSGIVGTSESRISAKYGTPCENGGYNFKLTNSASTDNIVNASYIVQASTSVGVDIAVSRVYTNTTGELQIKKSSGSFSVGDKITVIGNLFL